MELGDIILVFAPT